MVNIINPNTSIATLNSPEIFKANIGAFAGFKTVEGEDVTLPDPGTSVDNTLGDRKLNQPVPTNSVIQAPSPAPQVGVVMGSGGGAAAVAAGAGVGGVGSSVAVVAGPTATAGRKRTSTVVVTETGAASTVTAGAPAVGQNAGTTMDAECTDEAEPSSEPLATAPAAAVVGAGSAVKSAFQSPTAVVATAVARPVATIANTGASSGSATGGSCTEGSLVCSTDGTKFSMCVNGVAGPPQAVAAGTACRNGAIGYAKMIRKRRVWF
jgi:hypothetical protein